VLMRECQTAPFFSGLATPDVCKSAASSSHIEREIDRMLLHLEGVDMCSLSRVLGICACLRIG
jgi:hypothetical protein